MILVNMSQNLFISFIINSSNGDAVPTVPQYLPENITDFNSLSAFKRTI